MRGILKWILVLLGLLEFFLAIIQLPAVLGKTSFFDVGSMIALLAYLLAAGLLPVGITKVLMRRPTGWIFLILGHFFWFSWVGVQIDLVQELIVFMLR